MREGDLPEMEVIVSLTYGLDFLIWVCELQKLNSFWNLVSKYLWRIKQCEMEPWFYYRGCCKGDFVSCNCLGTSVWSLHLKLILQALIVWGCSWSGNSLHWEIHFYSWISWPLSRVKINFVPLHPALLTMALAAAPPAWNFQHLQDQLPFPGGSSALLSSLSLSKILHIKGVDSPDLKSKEITLASFKKKAE